MKIRVNDVQTRLLEKARAEISDAAGNNEILSRKEQSKLSPDLQKTADILRHNKGPGARITVDELVESYQNYTAKVLGAVNRKGETWLSKKETESIFDATLKGKIWDIRSQIARDGAVNATGDSKPLAELKELAKKFVVDNASEERFSSGIDDGKLFPGLSSGNAGLQTYFLTGDAAKRLTDFAGHWPWDAPGLADFDPKKQVLIAVRSTEDEDDLYLNVMNRHTGAVQPYGEMGWIDLGYWLDEGKLSLNAFEALVGPIADYSSPDYLLETDCWEVMKELVTEPGTQLL